MTDLEAVREIWTRAISGHEGAVLVDWRPGDGGGFSWSVGADRLFAGSAMIGAFLAELVSDDVAAGRLDHEQLVTVRPEHVAADLGPLASWQLPDEVSLHNLVHLMLTQRDGTALNAVIELLGDTAAVNDRLAAAGLRTRVRHWAGSEGHADPRCADLGPDPDMVAEPGVSVVVPREQHELMQRLVHLPQHARVRKMLGAQQDRCCLARLIDPRLEFPHQVGAVEGVRHDAGILVCDNGHELAVTVFLDTDDVLERVDHPACVAMGRAMGETRRELVARA